jgi:phytoene synthase
MTPDEYCQEKAGSSGSSFYYSFLFLPPKERQAITALYAFCREVDDVVDDCSDTAIAQTTLNWWRTEVENAFNGKAQHPVTRALTTSISNFDLNKDHFHELIAGMEMDLIQSRYQDFNELQRYCYRAASVVGLLSASIFGYSNKETEGYAIDLGTAFQLTNIIRDVGEDARRGRIYLPADEMQRFGVSEQDILQGRQTQQFIQLMAYQADRAMDYYNKAFSRLPDNDRCRQRPGLIMSAIYKQLLERLQATQFPVFNKRTSLTPVKKLWIAWRTARHEKRACARHNKS